MKDMAKAIVQKTEMTIPWNQNELARSLLEYVYGSGIWDSEFIGKRQALLKKNISTLTQAEIFTYLTVIIAGDRVNEGYYDEKLLDGTIKKLMKRYLEVTT